MGLTTRQCKSARCRREVVDVLLVGITGHKEDVIDPEPATWDKGGRVRISPVQPGVARYPLARKLTSARQAFGAGELYRLHSESCAGGRGRTAPRSREANG